jgi:hypothetical protein
MTRIRGEPRRRPCGHRPCGHATCVRGRAGAPTATAEGARHSLGGERLDRCRHGTDGSVEHASPKRAWLVSGHGCQRARPRPAARRVLCVGQVRLPRVGRRPARTLAPPCSVATTRRFVACPHPRTVGLCSRSRSARSALRLVASCGHGAEGGTAQRGPARLSDPLEAIEETLDNGVLVGPYVRRGALHSIWCSARRGQPSASARAGGERTDLTLQVVDFDATLFQEVDHVLLQFPALSCRLCGRRAAR